MTWVKIDDQFTDHPKIAQAGPLAGWLYVCGLTYCARYLTDGFIPKGQLRKLADVDDAGALAGALVSAGLWDWDEERAGYCVHDYLHYNPKADDVRDKKQDVSQKRSEAGSKGAASRWQTDGNADSKADGKTMAPSPSPIPSQEEDSPLRGEQAREEGVISQGQRSEAVGPPEAEGQEMAALPKARRQKTAHPAIALFERGFRQVKNRSPAISQPYEGRAMALYDGQGEETYCRALSGFFGCLRGSDTYPRQEGFTLAVFVRQFDKWEGGEPPTYTDGKKDATLPAGPRQQTAAEWRRGRQLPDAERPPGPAPLPPGADALPG